MVTINIDQMVAGYWLLVATFPSETLQWNWDPERLISSEYSVERNRRMLTSDPSRPSICQLSTVNRQLSTENW